MRFSSVVLVSVAAPYGAEGSSILGGIFDSGMKMYNKIRERGRQSNQTSQEPKCKQENLPSLWDYIADRSKQGMKRGEADRLLSSYRVVHDAAALTPLSRDTIVRIGGDDDSQIDSWQQTLNRMNEITTQITTAEKLEKSKRVDPTVFGWNLTQLRCRRDGKRVIGSSGDILNEVIPPTHVVVLQSPRYIGNNGVLFEGTAGNREVIAQYWTSCRDEKNGDYLFNQFLILEALNFLKLNVAPEIMGLSSPVIASPEIIGSDARVRSSACPWGKIGTLRGLFTKPLMNANSVDEYLTQRNGRISLPGEKLMLVVDIIKIGKLIIEAIAKLHNAGFLYNRLDDFGSSIRVVKIGDNFKVQLVDFANAFFFPNKVGSTKKSDRVLSYAATPGQLQQAPYGRRDDLFVAIEFIARMLASLNKEENNFLQSFLEDNRNTTESLLEFKKSQSLFLDLNVKVRKSNNPLVSVNSYCYSFGVTDEEKGICRQTLNHLNDSLKLVQSITDADKRPNYEGIVEGFVRAIDSAKEMK